jgi:hypothetical protein
MAEESGGGSDTARKSSVARRTRLRINRRTRQTAPLSAARFGMRAPSSDCPLALLVEVAKALHAPLAGVALAVRADAGREPAPNQDRSFAERVRTAPSLTEAQRRRWLTLLAADLA